MTFDYFHLSLLVGMLSLCVLWICDDKQIRKVPYFCILNYSVLVAFLQGVGTMNAMAYASQASAAKFAVCWLLVPAVLWGIQKKWVQPAIQVFLSFLVADSVALLCGSQGMFVGTTLSTLVSAIFLPLFFRDRYLRWCVPIVLGAILYIHGASSLVALGVNACFYFYTHVRTRFDILSVFGVAGLGVWFLEHGKLESRELLWRPAFSWWWAHADIFVGTGPWSYEWLSGIINPERPVMWMHSDWLQYLFEFGIFGLVCAIAIAGLGLWEVRKDLTKVGILVSLFTGMLVYSPMQFFPVWALVLLMVRE